MGSATPYLRKSSCFGRTLRVASGLGHVEFTWCEVELARVCYSAREPHLLPCSPLSVFPLRVQIPNWSENRIARKAWTEVRVDLPFCGSEGGRFGFRTPDFKDLAQAVGARVVTPCLNLTPPRTARDSSWFCHPFRAGRRLCLLDKTKATTGALKNSVARSQTRRRRPQRLEIDPSASSPCRSRPAPTKPRL